MNEGAETPAIREDEVRTIARLAHLDLSDEEVARMTRELGSILTYVRQLAGLDVTGVPPTAHVQLDALPMRKDELVESLPRELALKEAPDVRDDGFAVPAFVDEG
jgi:aspartyl-tRNA(Asn)/glutamyl-tRNA(Gln) amidotransferase subunit C